MNNWKTTAGGIVDVTLNSGTPEDAGYVILIHGLWMHGLVFAPYQYWLEKKGFAVRRCSYPSWSRSLEQNVDRLARYVAETPGRRIGLVCHSLGGLIAMAMLTKRADPRINRLVLMGTPWADCHCGHYMANRKALAPFLGRSMEEWLSLPRPPVPESVDIGVMAGTRRWGLGCVIPGLPLPNDGVVAVEETRLLEAKDSITLPVSHSGMLISPICARQAANFLQTGQFIHA